MMMRLLFTGVAALALTGIISGQPAPAPAVSGMDEDIEVLRSVLLQKLHPTTRYRSFLSALGAYDAADVRLWDVETGQEAYRYWQPVQRYGQAELWDFGTTADGRYLVSQTASQGVTQIEGFYQKGRGVVLTIGVAGVMPKPEKPQTKAPPAISDWEQARRRLRGEGATSGWTTVTQHPPALADVVMTVLAQNGHHLRGMGAEEAITVVIVYRPTAEAATRSAARESVLRPAVSQPDVEQETIGDLHLKQAQYKAAQAAFQKAVEAFKPTNPHSPFSDEAAKLDAQLRGRWKQLYTKLAQAALQAGDLDAANAALDKARNPQIGTTPTPEMPASVAVPAKIIITSPKKSLLDDAKGGMDLETFKKLATVERSGGK
jgi:hypothetical protein